MSTGTVAEGAPAAYRTPAYSWVVLAMLAFIYIFNFLDRQLMSTLIESIKKDTGYTLRTILDLLRFRGAASVKLCALLDKSARREIDVPIDYRGFEIEDVFVVGYGLDCAERYRNLPYIGVYEGGEEES
jgi:hypoxanthine phosphoribosyltransferase